MNPSQGPSVLDWIQDELQTLDDLSLRRRLTIRESSQDPSHIQLAEHALVNFGSNDYLGLASHGLVKSAVQVAQQRGWGSGASPQVTGRATEHAALEVELAAFEQTEAALLFSTGYAANVGTVSSLVGRGDMIFSDAKNHASIIDGCRLSGARIQTYPHLDCDYLRKSIAQAGDFRRRLIVTDSLFSMDGDLAPLDQLVEIADDYQAMLMVDEAHATGVFGESGRGVCEHFGVEERVSVRVGTFSKAFGSLGGFAVGSRHLIEWLSNRARTYFFSTAAPEAVAATGRAALRLVQDEPQRRVTLLQRAEKLRRRLQGDGWQVGLSASQIIPVLIGQPELTLRLAEQLRGEGFFVPGIRPPSVPAGEALLRISVSYAHTEEMLQALADALLRCRSTHA